MLDYGIGEFEVVVQIQNFGYKDVSCLDVELEIFVWVQFEECGYM